MVCFGADLKPRWMPRSCQGGSVQKIACLKSICEHRHLVLCPVPGRIIANVADFDF